MYYLKPIFCILLLGLTFTACESDEINEDPETNESLQFFLDKVLDDLPFEPFNDSSKAIFRNSQNLEIGFELSISEDLIQFQIDSTFYEANKITFTYLSTVVFEAPNLSVEASVEFLPDLGYTEIIKCRSNPGDPKLTIIPNTAYKNTVLNKEFTWLGESFEDVYSNILIQENEFDKVKIFYQSPIGIIGFLDNSNRPWILDRFE